MTIDKNTLHEMREMLIATKTSLEEEVRRLSQPVDFGNDVEDFQSEEADEAEEFSGNMGQVLALKERLNDVNRALIKIEHETYGVCEQCQKEISLDILRQDPESRLCQECKKEIEMAA